MNHDPTAQQYCRIACLACRRLERGRHGYVVNAVVVPMVSVVVKMSRYTHRHAVKLVHYRQHLRNHTHADSIGGSGRETGKINKTINAVSLFLP